MTTCKILQGDAREVLATIPEGSVHCCVTSPPYWGLRDYGTPGQIGLEATPEAYVANMVEVFREVRRVLRDDGTLWLNLGDSYAGHNVGQWRDGNEVKNGVASNKNGVGYVDGLKPKDLVGIPWRVAFALQADGWYLRSDIIWSKPNPMPESVTDRCTKAHEYVFLLTKSARYYYDGDAIAEPCAGRNHHDLTGQGYHAPGQSPHNGNRSGNKARKYGADRGAPAGEHLGGSIPWEDRTGRRNRRTVWTITIKPFPGAHFATFPPKLIEPMILAGSPRGGTVLDPFTGAGTTGLVALEHGRHFLGIELNPDYIRLAQDRIAAVQSTLGFS